ncbi:MAG: antibiotic biosynthesis monooxygenase family protein [Rudaea sp.]
MYSAAFIFEPGVYDARFHELNALIDQAAKATEGYLGVESWRSADGQKSNATYYWATLDALKQFSNHPKHLEAKREYKKWYRGYHIVIAQVIRAYGDGAFAHFTPNEHAAAMKDSGA